MKLKMLSFASAVLLLFSFAMLPVAKADNDFSSYPALQGCTEITEKVGIKQSGRFGWKPKANHFNSVVIVGARRFVLDPVGSPRVNLYVAATGQRILSTARDGLRLKSKGRCNGLGEDICADTWITPIGWPGSRIQQRFGAVIVRVRARPGSTLGCRYYYVPEPSKRVQYANK